MNYQMESLQEMFQRAEAGRSATEDRLAALAAAVSTMSSTVESGGANARALERVAEGQDNIVAVLQGSGGGEGGLDAESRMRIRSIDVQLLKIFEEMASGRQASMDDLRGDIGSLTRAIRQLNRIASSAQAPDSRSE